GAVQVVGALGAADEIETRGRRGGGEHAGPDGDDEQQLASHGIPPVESVTRVFSSTAVTPRSARRKTQVSRVSRERRAGGRGNPSARRCPPSGGCRRASGRARATR